MKPVLEAGAFTGMLNPLTFGARYTVGTVACTQP